MSEPCAPTVPVPVDTVRAAVRADMPRTLEQLVELVAIPGIAWESFDAEALEHSAEAVAGVLRDAGLDEVEVRLQMETRGEPHAEQVVTRMRECGYRIFE